MIYNVSPMMVFPMIKDHWKIVITRQEPEVNDGKIYKQEVSGSYESVMWFRENILEQIKRQNNR